MKTILLVVFVIFPMAIFGADDIKIPFITNVNTVNKAPSKDTQAYQKSLSWDTESTNETLSKNAQIYEKSPLWNTESTVKNIDSNKIASTIKAVKTTVCSAVESGSIKVYFTLDAEGKFFGIGASSGAGIEVTFNCEKGKSH